MSHSVNPPISNQQKQLIFGTILGGSSLVMPKNGVSCYLSMRGKDLQWLYYKANFLSSLSGSKPFTDDNTGRWHSMCYPFFNSIRGDFYEKNTRKITMEALDILNDFAFAAWFGDCGKIINNRIVLNTHIWNKDGNEKISKYFKDIGYRCEILMERGCFRIKLDEKSSKNFYVLVEPHLPLWFINS